MSIKQKDMASAILSQIEHIQNSLMQEDTDNEEIKDTQQEALNTIEDFKSKQLYPALEQLAKNQEWDKFNIAFYGETNAGKSTIIETLRIYLKEKSKLDSIEEYKKFKNKLEALLMEVDELSKQEQANIIIKFFRRLFGKDTKKELIKTKAEIEDIEKQIKQTYDGAIISANTDFTKQTIAYNFLNDNGVEFNLLDLPGIEGKESIVVDEILNSVKKAHAIFYISSQPKAPEEKTLQKIKSQLNDQTEIYSIYNKRITNEKQLVKNVDEKQDGLNELEDKLRSVLNENYVCNLTISAQPAFLAVGECFDPKSDFARKKEKFLNAYDKDEILLKTNFIHFIDFLNKDILKDYKYKIKKANLNKFKVVVEEFASLLEQLGNKFLDLYNNLNKVAKASNDDLNSSIETSKAQVKLKANMLIDDFKRVTRSEIYDYIESDVSNSELKSKLENIFGINAKKIQQEYEKMMHAQMDSMNEQIQKDTQKLFEKMQGVVSKFENFDISGIKIDTKSGVDKIGLFGSIGGMMAIGITNFYNPLGWAALTASLVASIFGVIKSVFGFLNKSYKFSQQKKEADKNISKVSYDLNKELNEHIKNTFITFTEQKDKVVADIYQSVNHIKSISEQILNIKQNIKNIAKEIQIEGEKR